MKRTEKVDKALRAIRWLSDPAILERMGVTGKKRVSDLLPAEADKHVADGVFVSAEESKILAWVIAFPLVEVKKQRMRSIGWTKEMNDAIWRQQYSDIDPDAPWTPHLPNVPVQRQQVHDGVRAACFDLSCGFFQLALSEAIRPYFGVQDSSGRIFTYARLPMGFTMSVSILQAILEVLADAASAGLPVTNQVYVDNVRFVGAEGPLKQAVARWKGLCKTFGFTLNNEESNVPHVSGPHMGIYYDYQAGTVRIADQNVEKLKEARTCLFAANPSIEDMQIAFGLLFWGSEVLQTDISQYYFAMKWYSRRLSSVAGLSPYAQASAPAGSIWASARRDLEAWFGRVITNTQVIPAKSHKVAEFTLWTDSSSKGFGSVLLNRVTGEISWHMGQWDSDLLWQHINVKELRALSIAISHWSATIGDAPVSILIDNTSARYAIRKGFSGSLPMNQGLSDILPKLSALAVVAISHVTSADNLADLPSRGSPPDPCAVAVWSQRAFG